MRRVYLALLLLVAWFLFFYLPFFHYTAAHEVGIKLNRVDGKISLDKPGFNLSAPWVWVAKVEARPQRVCIESVAKAINCKLAVFQPNEFRELVKREGFRYYWWDNRLSVNFGHKEEYRGSRNLIRGYAFSNAEQGFIKVLEHISE
jgi:hypothetical protein